jgi:UDP-glucose 6-dehydrogenase
MGVLPVDCPHHAIVFHPSQIFFFGFAICAIVPQMAGKNTATNKKLLIGFIGQGYVGKNYADDYEERGYEVVRYSLEPAYIKNKDRIKECDIVFVAVWTPSTPKGFDISIVESVLPLAKDGAIVVLKSTVTPGMTVKLQKKFKKITIIFSPEFLSVGTAREDARHPFSNILGLPSDDSVHRTAAETVLATLPKADYELICKSGEAEIIKYSHNISGYTQIITFNLLYEVAKKVGANWDTVHQALLSDPYIPNRYSQPVHKSGRGAGGGCFIKDFAAFRGVYEKLMPKDAVSLAALKAFEKKNIQLLLDTKKDLELLSGVYGPKVVKAKVKPALGRSATTKKAR